MWVHQVSSGGLTTYDYHKRKFPIPLKHVLCTAGQRLLRNLSATTFFIALSPGCLTHMHRRTNSICWTLTPSNSSDTKDEVSLLSLNPLSHSPIQSRSLPFEMPMPNIEDLHGVITTGHCSKMPHMTLLDMGAIVKSFRVFEKLNELFRSALGLLNLLKKIGSKIFLTTSQRGLTT